MALLVVSVPASVALFVRERNAQRSGIWNAFFAVLGFMVFLTYAVILIQRR